MSRRSLLERFSTPTAASAATPAVSDSAIAIVDEAIVAFAGRTLVPVDEVTNCLLDLRSALAATTTIRDLQADAVAR